MVNEIAVALLSIKDDLLQRTLANVSGILGKLAYISERRENDSYVHWGLTRIYGEEASQRALQEVHRSLFLQVLRTPLRQLVEDVAPSAAGRQLQPIDFLEWLMNTSVRLVPPDTGGGTATHFNAVIQALSLLFAQPRLQGRARGAGSSGNLTISRQ